MSSPVDWQGGWWAGREATQWRTKWPCSSRLQGRLPKPIIKWEPQFGFRDTAAFPFSTPQHCPREWANPVHQIREKWAMEVADLTARSRGQIRHKSQAVHQKWQGIVPSMFTLPLCSRNHYMVRHAYLCISSHSTPSTLLHGHQAPPLWSPFFFLTYHWMKCSSLASLSSWLLPSFRSQFVVVVCFAFFVKTYFKPSHHAFWWNLWSILFNF